MLSITINDKTSDWRDEAVAPKGRKTELWSYIVNWSNQIKMVILTHAQQKTNRTNRQLLQCMSYPKNMDSVVVGTKIFTERHQKSAHLRDEKT